MDIRGIESEERNDSPPNRADSSAAAARMRQAINAAAMGIGSQHELEAAARELVTELRQANEPPEQMLLQIKQILAEAGLRPSHGPADPALIIERHASVYRNVIESSIRLYFQHRNNEDVAPT